MMMYLRNDYHKSNGPVMIDAATTNIAMRMLESHRRTSLCDVLDRDDVITLVFPELADPDAVEAGEATGVAGL